MPTHPERIVRLTTGPIFTWWVKHVASRLDPLIFKATNGRLTSMGPAAMPMLTLTTVGRKSGTDSPASHTRSTWRAWSAAATT